MNALGFEGADLSDPRWTRRRFLANSLLGACGMAAWRLGAPVAYALPTPPNAAPQGRARAVIQIWMWGGPCHLDTFDPKPNAGEDYTGPFKQPMATSVDGVFINELLPKLAARAEHYSIIRGMTHGINGHETAAYIVQTGRPPGGRLTFPCAGAVVNLFKGYGADYTSMIPPYIVLTQPQGRFSEAGFLGLRYKPFATGGDPARTPFAVEGIVLPGVPRERQVRRRELLSALNTWRRALAQDPLMAQADAARDQAYDLILGDGAQVFDLSREPEAVRERYGKNTFGQSCLAARRLVETGVPYVTINYGLSLIHI